MITRVDSRRYIAMLVAVATVMPTLALSGCGKSNDNAAPAGGGMTSTAPMQSPSAPAAPKQGLSTKQKVVILAGAALLYYLYKKHQANQSAQSGQANHQLYQSKNGGIYYRDDQHKAVWVTAPTQGISVPAAQVQQYAPDYQQYQNKPVTIPQGVQTVPATQFDPSLLGG